MTAALETKPVKSDTPDWLGLGKTAIPGAARAGTDLKGSAEFEDLQTETQKALSVASAKDVDWPKIVRLAGEILAAKSKDLRIAAYGTIGLIQTRKVEGFILGCRVYLDLLENYWDDAFPAPTQQKARTRVIAWWIERNVNALRAFQKLPFPREEAQDLLERFRKANDFLKPRLDEAPSFAALTEWLGKFASPSEAARVPEPSSPSQAAKTTPPPTAEITTDEDAKRALDALTQSASRLSSYWQSRDLANPFVYRLNRIAYWLPVEECPPVTEGATLIPAPDSELMERLAHLMGEKQWENVVTFAEAEAFQSIFWLDVQRACAQALEAMGDRFAHAAEAVSHETAAFVARLPGVIEQTFADQTPFADEATRLWLRHLATSSTGPETAWPAVPEKDLESAIRQDVERIKPLLKRHKFQEAAQAFQDRLKTAASAREQFLCRLEFADVLARTAGPSWFAPQAERILEDIDTFRLIDFEPALALRGITRALKGYQAQSDSVSKKRSEELLRRLAQIDLTEFVRLGGAH